MIFAVVRYMMWFMHIYDICYLGISRHISWLHARWNCRDMPLRHELGRFLGRFAHHSSTLNHFWSPQQRWCSLVGGLLPFFIFAYIGNVIIPTDVHIFQRGGPTTNQKMMLENWLRCIGCLTATKGINSNRHLAKEPKTSHNRWFSCRFVNRTPMFPVPWETEVLEIEYGRQWFCTYSHY